MTRGTLLGPLGLKSRQDNTETLSRNTEVCVKAMCTLWGGAKGVDQHDDSGGEGLQEFLGDETLKQSTAGSHHVKTTTYFVNQQRDHTDPNAMPNDKRWHVKARTGGLAKDLHGVIHAFEALPPMERAANVNYYMKSVRGIQVSQRRTHAVRKPASRRRPPMLLPSNASSDRWVRPDR